MFKNCPSLTTPPDLPATTLTESCYYEMFADCTGLTEAPDLPATTLAVCCYYSMFSNCTNLVTAPALPATTLAGMCYQLMFTLCTGLTTAPALPATTLVDGCYSYMFFGCTNLTTAPELPAPTLESNCYSWMFYGCNQLNQVTCLATSGINSNNSTMYWLYDVPSTGTFYKASGIVVGENGWTPNSASGIPTGWTTEDHVEGALHGKFSVSSTKQVYFSQGNLQYIGSAATPYWKFADKQWNYFGTTTSQGSILDNKDRDLFGWGTSGYNHGASYYQPYITYDSESGYYAYGDYSYNLNDQTGQADWGYNAISNGGNTENSGWRTLTKDEWGYVFDTRTTTSGVRYAKATVNGVAGVILLPDNWSASYYTLSSANTANAAFTSNSVSSSDWATKFEANGAVFLPAAGSRVSISLYDVGSAGQYWSSTHINQNKVYCVIFESDKLYPQWDQYRRSCGYSVRLVKDAN